MQRLWGRGYTGEEIAAKLDTTLTTVARDKAFISERIKKEYSPGKVLNVILAEMTVNFDQAVIEFWNIYRTADNSNAETGAMNGIIRAIKERANLLQSLGIATNDLGTLTTKTITPDSLMELLAKVGGALPEDQRPAYFASIKKEMGDKDDDGGGGSK